MKKPTRWAIQVVDRDGRVMYLRRGARPGLGPIAQFRSKTDAEVNIDLIRPGLEDAQIAVIRYTPALEGR